MPDHRARTSSADRLLFLYSVICALSLETAVSNLIDPNASIVPIDRSVLPLTIAFVVTIVPFYHGAFRHLDDFYVLNPDRQVGRGALMVDFAFLFLQGAMLFALASLTPVRGFFTGTLISLLLLDIVWAFVTSMYCAVPGLSRTEVRQQAARWFWRRGTHHEPGVPQPELGWAFNNMVWLVILVAAALIDETLWDSARASWVVAIFAVSRTVIDYRISWSFYFPD